MKKEYKIAILNDEKVLTGFKQLEVDLSEKDHKEMTEHLIGSGVYIGKHKTEGEIMVVPDECNLKPNEYRWDEKCFQRLGTGHGKPRKFVNNVSKEHAEYLFFKAVIEGKPIPHDCKEVLVEQYEINLKKTHEEVLKRGGNN